MNGKRTRQVVALEEKRITGIMRRQEKELTPYIYIYIGNSSARKKRPTCIIFSGNSSSAKQSASIFEAG